MKKLHKVFNSAVLALALLGGVTEATAAEPTEAQQKQEAVAGKIMLGGMLVVAGAYALLYSGFKSGLPKK